MAKDASGEQQRAGRNWTEIASDFDLRTFLRITGWGSAAVAALFLASASVLSGSGAQRLFSAGQVEPPLTPAELTARAAATDDAIRQLTQTVRRLSAEREQTAARVATLERSLEDVTGSIKSAANTPSATPPSPAAPAPDARAGTAAPASGVAVSTASSAGAPTTRPTTAAANVTSPSATAPSAIAPSAPAPSAPAPSAAAPAEVAEAAGARMAGDLGIDVGGAVNFDGLRVLWNSTREHNPSLFENLFPLVAVRESSKTHNAELRLLIGPLAGPDAAGRICAALSAARRYCQPVAFEGQRLQIADSAPEHNAAPPTPRKRAAAAERKPRTGQ